MICLSLGECFSSVARSFQQFRHNALCVTNRTTNNDKTGEIAVAHRQRDSRKSENGINKLVRGSRKSENCVNKLAMASRKCEIATKNPAAGNRRSEIGAKNQRETIAHVKLALKTNERQLHT
jgi:hypothetical protein